MVANVEIREGNGVEEKGKEREWRREKRGKKKMNGGWM